MSHTDKAQILIKAATRFAKDKHDCTGLVLAGSYANNTQNEGSDIDLIFIVNRPAEYIDDTSWVEGFGDVQSVEI